MSAMPLMLVLLLAQAQGAAPVLVDIRDLTPREYRASAFVLTAPQDVQITAVGAEPWPDRLRQRDEKHWQDDDQTTWPAAAWILDARTRAVVWDLRSAETRRESTGARYRRSAAAQSHPDASRQAAGPTRPRGNRLGCGASPVPCTCRPEPTKPT